MERQTMAAGSSGVPRKSFNVKQDSRCSARGLSRKMSFSSSSSEVYYARAPVAVPFVWESQPGTPKAKFHDNPLPPLTPPPSFHCNSMNKPTKIRQSKPKFLQTVLPKLSPRKTIHQPSPGSSLSSSRSRSAPSSPLTPSRINTQWKSQTSSPWSSYDSRIDEEDECRSPVSTLCFGIGRGAYPSNIVKLLRREFAS
ncbi:uncharacterized protein LOC127790064 [Diospyros lotus]|uniref:uncharacterized protein LOC127790064 n=1 Tax=Diospyros lotus TaxID=55363 RepID=UPI002255E8E0|nr:uncharacterized protein LOC127790064 [Diospyros lotus]